jgi:hypothetical protein
MVLITSELASNAILHSDSKGEFFTVRAKIFPGYLLLEVEDLGELAPDVPPGCCPAARWPPRTPEIPEMPNGPAACPPDFWLVIIRSALQGERRAARGPASRARPALPAGRRLR